MFSLFCLYLYHIQIPGTVKMKYETKIKQLITELSDLQHKYAEVSKIANEKRSLAEGQLRTLRVAVETLKAEKQRMIKRMKEDAERIKEMNAANDREIQALRRSERAALDGRKKAEREIEQQRTSALLHRTAPTGSNSPQAKVNSFLKKPQTPKGITKTAKRNPRFGGPSEKHDTKESSIPTPTKATTKSPGSTRLQVSQKKQVIDRAIYGYISGQHAINVMEDMLKKRERLRTEKLELEQERHRVVLAQEEEALNHGGLLLDFASEPQYMDDRLAMIDAEVAYINARIRALQAEAAALGFVTTIDKGLRLEDGKEGTTSDEEELMTKLIQKGMNDDAMGLPPGSGASVAFDSSIAILRSMDLSESREFLEMLFEDMVTVRTHENGLQVQVANQEKVIEDLKRALQAMRLAAVGATLGYEKRCDGLEKKLRQLGGSSSDDLSSKSLTEGSSEEDENDAEVARLNLAAFGDSGDLTPSPILRGDLAKELDQSEWTPLPNGARPRPGSVAEAVLDVKAKRASTIFDQLYEDAMKSTEEASPKVGGTGGEFSRILMANNERRVSWAGVPPASVEGLADGAPERVQPPHRLSRSISTSAISHKSSMERADAKQRGNMSMYGHRRGGSSSGGSGGGQGMGNGPNGGLHRSSSSMNRISSMTNGHDHAQNQQQQLPRGAYATTASSRQHTAETIAQRRSSTPIHSPAIGPKSTARPRYNTGTAPGTPLTIQTGFANGYSPQQQTLRHSKSHQQPLNNNNYNQRQNYDARRASTPSPGLTGKRFSDGGGPGSQAVAAAAAAVQRTPNGNGRPLSRIGAASMMTTTPTATNMVHGLVSPGFQHSAADVNFGYGHHAHHGSSSQDHYHTHHHNGSSRRISGSWDDNQNVYERLASVHTQASQARVLATRSNSSMGHHAQHPMMGAASTGGSMMTAIQQQSQSQSQGKGSVNGSSQDRMRMHRPSVDGLMTMMSASAAAAAAEAASFASSAGDDAHLPTERNWSSTSSSSTASSASSTTSTLTAATNSPTLQEHEEIRASIQTSLSKAEVGPVF